MNMRPHEHESVSRPMRPPRFYRTTHAVLCPVMKLFGLSCRQFAELASVRMDRPLRRWESLRFVFHRTMCGLCRRLPEQLDHLRALTRCVVQHEPAPAAAPTAEELTPEAVERIRRALRDEDGTPVSAGDADP